MSNLTRNQLNKSFALPVSQTSEPGAAITPDQIISALIGADSVVLKGFNPVQTKPLPFWVPTISQFDVAMSAPAARKASLLTHRLSVLAVLIMLACVGLLTYWGQQMYGLAAATSKAQAQSKAASWAVKSVNDGGVQIQMGSILLPVPLGAMLPNGEILRGVDVQLQSYSTDTQTTVVKKQ